MAVFLEYLVFLNALVHAQGHMYITDSALSKAIDSISESNGDRKLASSNNFVCSG